MALVAHKGEDILFGSIPDTLPTPDVARLIPFELALELEAVPLAMEDGVLTLAVASLGDPKLIDALVDITGHQVFPVLSPRDQLEAALLRLKALACGESSDQIDHIKREDGMLPIRGVSHGDLDDILALARRTGVFTSRELAVIKELVEIQLGNPNQEDYRSFIVEADSHIVGFACCGPTPMTDGTYDLYWIFVDPSHQGRAIGSALLGEVEKAIRRAKGRMVIVDTSSTRPYLPARRFYQKHGLRKVAEVKHYYRPGDSRLTYVKRFLQDTSEEWK